MMRFLAGEFKSTTEIGFGIFCTNGEGTLSTNHTFRLRNLSYDRVLEAFLRNLNDFFKLLELCKKDEIEVFRLGSNFIPYASHREFKEEWFSRLEPYLKEASERLREYQIRITMHPGQFVILNSPKLEVIENSLRELEYHFWVLDSLGVGNDGIVIVHIGGLYENKERATERFINTVERNPWLKRRLGVENDERLFNAKQVLDIAKALKIPFVFDYFHHKVNPSEFDQSEILETWKERMGPPKFHISSQGKGKRGVHGDYIDVKDFLDFLRFLRPLKVKKVHLMIEAKKKERALQRLKEELEDVGLLTHQ